MRPVDPCSRPAALCVACDNKETQHRTRIEMTKSARPHSKVGHRRPLAALRGLFAGKGLFVPSSAFDRDVRPDFSYDPILPNPGPLKPEDRLVFVHIEKTAGSTAHHVFAQHFDEEEVCPHRFANLLYWRPEHLARYRFFVLHAHLRALRSIPQPLKFLTFLREPVARLRSHYNYWRSLNDRVVEEEGLDHIRFLKRLKLKELLTPSRLSVMPEFWNLATHRLAGDLFLAPSGHPWRDEAELLDAALGNLANFATFGITEFPELSFQCIADDLAIPNRYDGIRVNVTAANAEIEPDRYDPVNRFDVDDETLECIDRATRLDGVVYDTGVGLFRDRLRRGVVLDALIPPHLRTARLDTGQGELVIGDHHRGAVLYGPYHTLPAGRYRAAVWIQANIPANRKTPWSIDLDVCSETSRIHAARAVDRVELADRWFEPVEIDFTLPSPTASVEIRLHVSGVPTLAARRGVSLRLL